ncbi:hypothetical protein PRUB_a4656 [Pseudoalteromonas rubra]|uniref:Uncharacterized protein n=1 Tax=Pseudoalteromonas rubra TaxID=43658 RepID=A0A8T0CA39_9GAMM|nr:hypothetical protein PRUB_a4656 [Pseudoalteromonas rubra]
MLSTLFSRLKIDHLIKQIGITFCPCSAHQLQGMIPTRPNQPTP